MKHPYLNYSFDKKRLKALISWVFKKSGEAEALRVLDILKETGFRNATKAGISIGLHDLTTPATKSWLVSESQQSMNSTEIDFFGAKITATERSQRIIDTWHRASESLSKQVVDYFNIYDRFNPVYIMALSGARGNFSQVRQLIGMRGLMADQQGKIVNFPIRSNLREGLTITEYFISCSGARKGLVDTALRTADTGYLTRRLVDVSHHVVVKRIRCSTSRGILFKDLKSYNKILLSLKDRLIGRVLAEDISVTPQNSTSVVELGKNGKTQFKVKKDTEISPKLSVEITRHKDNVFIRSPLTCGFTHEVCQLCYGWSISQGSLVSLGDAVGVIAAQSIGEPGTQLTMRTFHTGGVFSGDLLQEIRAPHKGTVEFSKAFQGLLIRTGHGRIAFLSKTPGSLLLKNSLNSTTIPIPPFTMLFVRQHEKVEINTLLAEFSIQSKEGNQPIKTQQTIFAELSGKVIEDCSGKSYLKYLKESSFLKESLADNDLQHRLTYLLRSTHAKSNDISQFLKSYKTKDLENDTFRYVEPVKSGRLGLLKILSTRIGATFNYTSPVTTSCFLLDSARFKSFASYVDQRSWYTSKSSAHAPSGQEHRAQIVPHAMCKYKSKRANCFCFATAKSTICKKICNPCPFGSKGGLLKQNLYERTAFAGPKQRVASPKRGSGLEVGGKGSKSKLCTCMGHIKEKTRLSQYLHPELVKQNRFLLQTIAEHGDIVEEEYKNGI